MEWDGHIPSFLGVWVITEDKSPTQTNNPPTWGVFIEGFIAI